MKLRAIHLLRKLETIDRDLVELETLQDRIRDDRIYADRLRSSLTDEALRLKSLRSRILSQVIHDPPQGLQSRLADGSGRSGLEGTKPELTLASSSAGKTPIPRKDSPAADAQEAPKPNEAARTPQTTPARAGKKRGRRAAAETKGEASKADGFEFRYE